MLFLHFLIFSFENRAFCLKKGVFCNFSIIFPAETDVFGSKAIFTDWRILCENLQKNREKSIEESRLNFEICGDMIIVIHCVLFYSTK